MTIKTIHLNIGKEKPIILLATDGPGNPKKDATSISRFRIVVSMRNKVQFNYSGPYNALYDGQFESSRYRLLERLLKIFDKLEIHEKEVTLFYDGDLLVLVRKDDNGDLLTDNVFSLVSFGRRSLGRKDEPIKALYRGLLEVLTYDGALRYQESLRKPYERGGEIK